MTETTRVGSQAGRWLALCAVALAALGYGCGDDDYGPYDVVGLSCRAEIDCAPGAECRTGGDFPDGTCTLPCNSHLDCPRFSSCVDPGGGLCLVGCVNDADCRPKYKCKAKHDRDGNGDSFVCIK